MVPAVADVSAQSELPVEGAARSRITKHVVRTFLGLSVFLFVVSLFQKVCQYGDHVVASNQYFDSRLPIYGFAAVLCGWLNLVGTIIGAKAVFHEPYAYCMKLVGQLGWLANPSSVLALVLFSITRKWSVYLSFAALGCAIISLMILGVSDPYHVIQGEIDIREPFHMMEGRITWLLSILFLAVANALVGFNEEARQ
jgi:hypothetical protein